MREIQNTNNLAEMDLFLEGLLMEKGLGEAPNEVKVKLKEDLAVRLEKWLVADMVAQLSEAQAEEFEQFLDSNPTQASITEQLQAVIPNHEQIYQDSLLGFKQAYLS